MKQFWLVLLTFLIFIAPLSCCAKETETEAAVLSLSSFSGGGPEYSITIEDPQIVRYTCRKEYDVPDGEMQELYLSKVEIQNLEETPGIRVLNYLDEKDPMFCFRGKITEYDYLRGAVSAVLWSGAAAGIVVAGAAGICAKRAVRRGSVK